MKIIYWIGISYGIIIIMLNILTTIDLNKWVVASAYMMLGILILMTTRKRRKPGKTH